MVRREAKRPTTSPGTIAPFRRLSASEVAVDAYRRLAVLQREVRPEHVGEVLSAQIQLWELIIEGRAP